MYQHGGDIYTYQNCLDFSANMNLLGTPDRVIQAACEGAFLSHCYPDIHCRELREELSKTEKVSIEQIICGNGAADLIFSLVLAKKPKKALLLTPTFYEYEQALKIVDCEIIYYPLQEKFDFLLQKDYLEWLTKDVDMVFLCNPNNPTGTLTEMELMESIIYQCERNQSLLIVDECFIDFIENKERYSVKEHLKQSKYLFVLKAFTKLYAMAGLRLGYGLGSNLELQEQMKQVSQPWSVSIPAQMAGIAALKEENYIKQSMEILKQERQYVKQELEELNMKTYDSRANYIFFKGEKGLYERCLEKGVLIRDCSNYRGLEEGYYRIAVKKHEENRRLMKALKE